MADIIPYVETGNYVAYNNERGGVIECLKQDRIVDLDTEFHSVPEWVSAKSMVSSWLADAAIYELWLGTDGGSAQKVYYSDLPWPIGKVLYFKKVHSVKLQLGINKENAERREEQVVYLLLLFMFVGSLTCICALFNSCQLIINLFFGREHNVIDEGLLETDITN